VVQICQTRIQADPDYWALVTLGEAHLILGDINEAARHYRNAASKRPLNIAEKSSTRHQARMLLRIWGMILICWMTALTYLPTAFFRTGDRCFQGIGGRTSGSSAGRNENPDQRTDKKTQPLHCLCVRPVRQISCLWNCFVK
jgi:hypothetical protein